LQLTLEDLIFGYDPSDNPTSITDNRNPAEWPVGAKTHFAYDDE
jgi:hypothetical protein